MTSIRKPSTKTSNPIRRAIAANQRRLDKAALSRLEKSVLPFVESGGPRGVYVRDYPGGQINATGAKYLLDDVGHLLNAAHADKYALAGVPTALVPQTAMPPAASRFGSANNINLAGPAAVAAAVGLGFLKFAKDAAVRGSRRVLIHEALQEYEDW